MFQSMFTPNEVKQGTELLENLLSMNDSVKKERVRFAMLGSRKIQICVASNFIWLYCICFSIEL